jgi:tRNA pseudouridine13 synthase
MPADWPRAGGEPASRAVLRHSPADFAVREQLGFELSGAGEHAWVQLQKTGLNTAELEERVARLCAVARRDIGVSGRKDRHAVTSQWLSVWLPGRADPDWKQLETSGDIRVLSVSRHARKLKRGVHRANAFELVLRHLEGDAGELQQRLQQVRSAGFPNYFGEQRFGLAGSTLQQALHWSRRGAPRLSRNRRSLYLSALRAFLFNQLLAARVTDGSWNRVLSGDVCMLHGTHSLFSCEQTDQDIGRRVSDGDLHPALPLWGRGQLLASGAVRAAQAAQLAPQRGVCAFLEDAGLSLAYRPARALADDFCWQFCDYACLRLGFTLSAGSYATALLRELMHYTEKSGDKGGANSSEPG